MTEEQNTSAAPAEETPTAATPAPEATATVESTPAPSAPEPQPKPAPSAPVEDSLYIWGLGRRKSSVARVRIKRGGAGQVRINKRPMAEYFHRAIDMHNLLEPLRATRTLDQLDIFITVNGGGMTGQAGAARLGIARALAKYDESLLDILRAGGFLTRDARNRERKKYGQKGARASYQFSKR